MLVLFLCFSDKRFFSTIMNTCIKVAQNFHFYSNLLRSADKLSFVNTVYSAWSQGLESKVYAFFFEISTELTVLKIGDLCITLSTPHVQCMLLSFYIYKYIRTNFLCLGYFSQIVSHLCHFSNWLVVCRAKWCYLLKKNKKNTNSWLDRVVLLSNQICSFEHTSPWHFLLREKYARISWIEINNWNYK